MQVSTRLPLDRERPDGEKSAGARTGTENGSREGGAWIRSGTGQQVLPGRGDQARVTADAPGGFSVQINLSKLCSTLVHLRMLTRFFAPYKFRDVRALQAKSTGIIKQNSNPVEHGHKK